MNCLHQYKLNFILFFSVITSAAFGQGSSPLASFQLSVNSGCAPLSVSITNTSLNATHFEWDFGNGSTSLAAQPSIMYSLKGIYDITLIAKNALGHSDTLVLKNAITVNDIPTADFNYSINSSCLNQNRISFNNLSTVGINYTWDFGDGNTSTLRNPTYSYAVSGNYMVKLMVSDSLGCSNFKQANQAITIQNSPQFSFTVNDSVGCDTSQLFSFNGHGNSITSWHWFFGDGDSSSIQNPTHKYNNAGDYSIRLIAINQFGCSDTLEKVNHIKIHNKPNLDFTSSINSGCTPLTVSFYKKLPIQGSTYQWNLGDKRAFSGDSIIANFDSSGSYSITLMTSYSNGCVDSLTKTSFINVKGGSQASFSYDTAALCKNGVVQFMNTTTNLSANSFTWNFGDNTTSNVINPSHSYNQSGHYSVSLTVTDTSLCSNTYTKSIDIKTIKAQFSTKKTWGCLPLTINFQNLSSNANKWHWNFGDGDTSQQKNPSHTYHSSGKFDVSLIIETTSGCIDSITYTNFITAFDDTLSGNLSDTIMGCLPLPLDFSDNQLGAKEWTWDFGNGDTSMIRNPTYTYNNPGTYTVTLKTFSSNGCPIYIENYATVQIDSIVPKITTLRFDCQQGIIQLTDSTENATSWLWNFGDGTYSTLQSPIHQFPDTIIYDISLTLFTSKGCMQSVYFPNYIDFKSCLVAGESPKSGKGSGTTNSQDTIHSRSFITQKCAPQMVRFSNPDTNAYAWSWDFGDGNTSILEHPMHVYRTPGLYTVILITDNPMGKDTTIWNNYITVNGPLATFTTSISYGCDSASVMFNNTSLNINKWTWNFENRIDSTSISLNQKFSYSFRNHPIRLIVNDTMGCSSSSIRILNFPKNEIYFSLPDSACVGDSLFFSASDSSATYRWSFGDGNSDSSQMTMHTYSTAGTYPIQVISKNSIGCEIIHQLDSIQIKGASAEFTIVDTVNCKNELFLFVPKDINADAYEWNFGNGVKSHSVFPSIKLNQAGIHQISLSVSKQGCQNNFTHPTAVQVKDVKANFKIEQLTNCYPIQISVTDTNSNNNQWEWKVDSTKINTQNHYSFFTQDSSLNISLKVTAQNGCIDSITKVFIPSTLHSDFEVLDTSGCAPLAVNFSNKSSNSIHSFWSFGDGDTSTATNPTHIYKNEGIFSVQLITNSIDGCYDTTTFQNAIQVSSIAANYTTSFNNTCAPMMVHFTDSSNTATSWKWSFGDGTNSTTKNPLKIYNQPGKYDVSLIVTNNNGCIDTLEVRNEVFVPGPIANFSVSDSVVCGISPIQFSDSSIDAVQWNWFFGDGNTSTLQNPSYTYNNHGNYSVTLKAIDSSGCSGVFTMPTQVAVNDQPVANFKIKDSIGCAPFEVKFTADSSNANNWKWNLGTAMTINDSSAIYTFTQPGAYSISLTTENEAGCIDSTRFDSLIVLYTPNSKITPVSPMCSNETPIKLNSQEAGGMWYGEGISNPITGIYNPNKAKSATDKVYYSFQGACSTSDTIYIKIKKAPEVDFSINNEEGCKQLDVQFESVFLGESTANSKPIYNWEQNGVTFGKTSTVSKTFSAGIYDISLSVKVENGCSDIIKKPALIKVFDSIPSETSMNRVSVLNDNEVIIEWQKNTNIAFSQNILYRKSSLDSSFKAIQTFSDPNQISFIDKSLNTLDLIYCYKIVSQDKCGQELKFNDVPFHCTINVSTKKLNKSAINIQWNNYEGAKIDFYEISRFDVATNTSKVIATVNSTQLEFKDTVAYCKDSYSYRIKAIGPNDLSQGSYSDTSVIKMGGISHLQTSDIIRATVEDNSSVLVEWTAVKVAPEFATGYVLYRSMDNLNFTPITFVSKTDTSYNDRNTSVDLERYFYQVEVINTCLNKNELTNTGTSILLKSTQIDDHTGNIKWTGYERWNSGVKHYEIQRLNKFNRWETIQIVPEDKREQIINF
jgi:PKD repeat protein